MCITWGVALFFPALYIPHRIQIVVVGRVMMAISAYLATNGVHEQVCVCLCVFLCGVTKPCVCWGLTKPS